jgi:hypothetical protein
MRKEYVRALRAHVRKRTRALSTSTLSSLTLVVADTCARTASRRAATTTRKRNRDFIVAPLITHITAPSTDVIITTSKARPPTAAEWLYASNQFTW